ncbi:alpha/beta hydrolase [Microbacterium hominis]|uniref:alpha/beta fold hydrolase n=1 Tax=Microbacterium TaxID=33882 RepID=UPI00168B8EC2|nr:MULTISPECIES: alpha/beta hydrolase [Microbacterium]QOC24989.1 alpha/beta hydrolase [Microbacterium hominis]QOC29036.1 alpha/beta hydrolase [Microbacterium hominis]QYF98751.1 alpha/beta hydrolase [Microbacterium sp. PAMC21962]
MATGSRGDRRRASIIDANTRMVHVDGADIAYREIGSGDRPPLVALTHLGGNLDAWDPEVIDALAQDRRVIVLGYRGVGRSTGRVRDTFDDMARDTIAAVLALGLDRIDLFGLSMGGMVAQTIVEEEATLVDHLVMSGTGPRGGAGLTRMTGVMLRGIARSVLTARPATSVLFFPRTDSGTRAAAAYQRRLKRRRTDRDAAVTPGVMRAQLRAVARWGAQPGPAHERMSTPTLTFHGEDDILVPVANANQLRTAFSALDVVTFRHAGHGVVSQHRDIVTGRIQSFLRA